MSVEMISHPDHYNIPGKKECIVEMEEKYGADWVAIFCLLNSEKYDYRAGNKALNPKKQDNDKSQWYINYAWKLVQENKIKNHEIIAKVVKFAYDKRTS